MSDRGPEFQPPAAPPPPGPGDPRVFDPRQPIGARTADPGTGRTGSRPPRPPRRWGPTVITAAVLAVAAVLIVTGVLVGRYHDQHATAASTPTPTVPVSTPEPTNAAGDVSSTVFDADTGSGTLAILDHAWTTAGEPSPQNGAYLLIEVQVKVSAGDVALGAPFFSAFDADSQSFTATSSTLRRPALPDATVSAGQTARGWIAFDIDRGRTLVMLAGEDARPIAALKVEG